ncbi:hypothetical protein [Streptomyces millisiae]|uniref:Uncharacterized protein n=1 Tax=Streptomyces millisiae TaxID=3075542 RepID=A0ABU2M0Y3_9ACTN|nr:hypothetical protein [Streptomyces sp. DSM 44918]MDT0323052.1 hypothetical protein [Streptomyces sp. DSM 44918]
MSARPTADTNAWKAAARRASPVAAERPFDRDENNWDYVAQRDIIAIVLYSLHLRDEQPIGAVPWGSVLWYLMDDARVIALVEQVLPAAGHEISPITRSGVDADPVAGRWRWLNRTWDPDAPIGHPDTARRAEHYGAVRGDDAEREPRWGGMSRAIGTGLPDPAVEVCTSWAASRVAAALAAERDGYRTHQRVLVTGGPHAGHYGYVRDLIWAGDDQAQAVAPGSPAAYAVDLDDIAGVVDIDAERLTDRADGRRWAARTPGSTKDIDVHRLNIPPAPHVSSEQNLTEILRRVANPEILPEDLRRAIATSRDHHHLQLDRQASPRPHRWTWRILQHWYQLGPTVNDDKISLWEVELTTHVNDPAPLHLLTRCEEEVSVLLARYTNAPQ